MDQTPRYCTYCGTQAPANASFCPRCGRALVHVLDETFLGDGALRSIGVAYGLWALCLVGVAGIHRFYAGKFVTGLIWLLTWGLLGLGLLIDLFLIPDMIDQKNRRLLHGRAYAQW